MMPPRGPVLVSVPADDRAACTQPLAARRVSTQLRPEPELLAQLGDARASSQPRCPAAAVSRKTTACTPVGLSVVGSIRLGLLDLLARPAPPARRRR